MTPTARRAALEVLGWTQRGLARRIGYDESTVRRWFTHGDAPPWFDPWFAALAEAVQAVPLPEGVLGAVRQQGRPLAASGPLGER